LIAERDAIQEKIERMGTAIQAIEVRAQETKALRCCEKSLEASVSPAFDRDHLEAAVRRVGNSLRGYSRIFPIGKPPSRTLRSTVCR